MNKFIDLYNFIDLAKNNRKYPPNTANGLVSALKLFEKQLNVDELGSVGLIEDNIEEIFIGVVGANKDKNIASLNTYKTRLLKVISDYQKYGINPSKMQGWQVSLSRPATHKTVKPDIKDRNLDKIETDLSTSVDTPVHKIDLSLKNGGRAVILVPNNLDRKDADTIKNILDSLTK